MQSPVHALLPLALGFVPLFELNRVIFSAASNNTIDGDPRACPTSVCVGTIECQMPSPEVDSAHLTFFQVKITLPDC